MTREEAIFTIEHRDGIMDYGETEQLAEALEIAIESLKAEPCGDAVSREDVLEIISDFGYKNTHEEMLINTRIKALPPVTPKQRTDVLDEIRAEISKLTCGDNEYRQALVKVADVIKCIDKHRKGESE